MPIITAIYENGVFRPLEPVEGVENGTEVELAMNTRETAWDKVKHLAGRIPDEELRRMQDAIEDAFEVVDHDGW